MSNLIVENLANKYSIPFEKGLSKICFTMVPLSDDPLSVYVIQSGWSDNGPLFHILTEYGDCMTTDYEFGNLNQVCEKHPEFKKIWESQVFQDVVITADTFLSVPNDADLGKQCRAVSLNAARTNISID